MSSLPLILLDKLSYSSNNNSDPNRINNHKNLYQQTTDCNNSIENSNSNNNNNNNNDKIIIIRNNNNNSTTINNSINNNNNNNNNNNSSLSSSNNSLNKLNNQTINGNNNKNKCSTCTYFLEENGEVFSENNNISISNTANNRKSISSDDIGEDLENERKDELVNLKPNNNIKSNNNNIQMRGLSRAWSSLDHPQSDSHQQSSINNFNIPSYQAIKLAINNLSHIDDYHKVKIGEGFFSSVFKVIHKSTAVVSCLKINNIRSNRSNVLRELQLMNGLLSHNHPNILHYQGAVIVDGSLHALTEYISGGNLEQLILDKGRNFTIESKYKISYDISHGMSYLHQKCGVIHRDLTSKNILVKEVDGDLNIITAIIGDFGLACFLPSKITRLGSVGSPYWSSPECLKGEWYDHTTDIFSFGILLCQMIARISADPDVLPRRKEDFGLDTHAYLQLINRENTFNNCCKLPTELNNQRIDSEDLIQPEPLQYNEHENISSDNDNTQDALVENSEERSLQNLLINLAFNCCHVNALHRPNFKQIEFKLKRLITNNIYFVNIHPFF